LLDYFNVRVRVARSTLVMAVELGLLAVNATGDELVRAVARPTTAVAPKAKSPVAPEAKPKTPVQINGRLRVCGTHLCNEAGKPIQLRGMSTNGTQWVARCLVDDVFDVLAKDWESSVFRVATYATEGGYEENPKKFTALASRLIDMASERGMYVIVDWHMVEPGDPSNDLQNAMTFFKKITERHKHQSNVLYEIVNEPVQVSWAKVKSYAEKVIPVIRAKDPDSVILVGTRGWSTFGVSEYDNEREVLRNPVRASNIMYTFHFYAQAHREKFLRTLDRVSSKLPVFVTEWGMQSWTGYANDFAMSQKFVDLMAKKKISWTNWSIGDGMGDGDIFKKGACSRGKFTDPNILKPAGVWIRQQIRGR
jgi:endoglucanase